MIQWMYCYVSRVLSIVLLPSVENEITSRHFIVFTFKDGGSIQVRLTKKDWPCYAAWMHRKSPPRIKVAGWTVKYYTDYCSVTVAVNRWCSESGKWNKMNMQITKSRDRSVRYAYARYSCQRKNLSKFMELIRPCMKMSKISMPEAFEHAEPQAA